MDEKKEVKGEWLDIGFIDAFQCSNCYSMVRQPYLFKKYHMDEFANFCPHCGFRNEMKAMRYQNCGAVTEKGKKDE